MTSDGGKSLVITGTQDKRLVSSPSERNLSEKEFLDLIALADSIRQFDERKRDRTVLNTVEGIPACEGNFPVSVAYDVAQSLGIPADYMERAIALKNPTIEQQLADIERYGVVPSFGAVVKTYETVLLRSLEEALPLDKFKSSSWSSRLGMLEGGDGEVYLHRVLESVHKRRFLFWETERVDTSSKRLVKLEFFSDKYKSIEPGRFAVKAQVNDPLFLRACGDTFEQLNQNFGKYLKFGDVFHHYVVE